METGQQTLTYHFEKEVDLTYKADSFTSRLEQLNELTTSLEQIIKNELQNSEGKIIKEAIKVMEKQTEENRMYYEASHATMKSLAIRYNDIVNDMNRQSSRCIMTLLI